jgi:hypothetical protein
MVIQILRSDRDPSFAGYGAPKPRSLLIHFQCKI